MFDRSTHVGHKIKGDLMVFDTAPWVAKGRKNWDPPIKWSIPEDGGSWLHPVKIAWSKCNVREFVVWSLSCPFHCWADVNKKQRRPSMVLPRDKSAAVQSIGSDQFENSFFLTYIFSLLGRSKELVFWSKHKERKGVYQWIYWSLATMIDQWMSGEGDQGDPADQGTQAQRHEGNGL
jgi:hypothetical protein